MPLVNSPLTPSIVEPNLPEDLSGVSYLIDLGVGLPGYAAGANGYASGSDAESLLLVVTALQVAVSQLIEIHRIEIAALNARRGFTGLTVEQAV